MRVGCGGLPEPAAVQLETKSFPGFVSTTATAAPTARRDRFPARQQNQVFSWFCLANCTFKASRPAKPTGRRQPVTGQKLNRLSAPPVRSAGLPGRKQVFSRFCLAQCLCFRCLPPFFRSRVGGAGCPRRWKSGTMLNRQPVNHLERFKVLASVRRPSITLRG